MKCSGGLLSLSRCTSFSKAAGRSMPLQFMRFLCIRMLKLLSALFLILRYLHFLFQDAAKALNTLQTKAQDLEQQAGVKVSHFYNCCLVGLIDLA